MRILIADDEALLREGLARLLAEAGFVITGLCADAESLLRMVDAQPPDVAIVDIRMPPGSRGGLLDRVARRQLDTSRSRMTLSPPAN